MAKQKSKYEKRRDWVKSELKKFEKKNPKASNSVKAKQSTALKLKARKKFK